MRRAAILALVAALAGLPALPAAAGSGGAERTAISGTIALSDEAPGGILVTPSGVIHQFGDIGLLVYDGDVSGSMMCYYQRNTISPAFDHLVAMCSTAGELTWNGRTGPARGRITTECKIATEYALYCDGVSVIHGSGDLEGVTLRMAWGGLYPSGSPFGFTGAAVAAHP